MVRGTKAARTGARTVTMAAKTGEKTATEAGASLSTPAAVVAGQAAAYWAVVAACRLAWLSCQRCLDQAHLPVRHPPKSKSLAAAVVGLGLTRRRQMPRMMMTQDRVPVPWVVKRRALPSHH